jgi:hypothetical protein
LPGTLSGSRSALVEPGPSAKTYRTIELGEGPDFIGTGVAFSPTRSAALRYWNMARQRYWLASLPPEQLAAFLKRTSDRELEAIATVNISLYICPYLTIVNQ